MAQISLKNYLAKLERLLDEASADEVIQHSRHLLKYFPKNAAAFRSLGLGLLLNGRWQEAESALRRVLTALPDDYRAHLGLSEIYTTMGRGDQAISHLERAFEQNPNSRELIDGLRGLYRRFRQTERVKIQLTTGAIARQYRRSGSPQQAISLLRSALERTPDRLDLSLLLADTLWETGAHVEAAEVAVDILKRLPDCIIANQIMTRLWLEAHRPSDAARYLSRIEAVDPILAYEIVQGPVPDNAFMVDEIDYQRVAQTELVSRRPDWLQTIGVSAPIESAAASEEEQPAWLADAISALPGSQTRRPASPSIEADDDDWMAAVRTPSLTNQLDLPPEFSSGARDVNTGELKALFEGDEAEEPPASWELNALAPMGDEEQPTFDDFTFDFGSPEAEAELDSPPAARDSRPAWMVDAPDEEDEPNLGVMGSEAAIHDDIPDWMHDAMFAAEADDSENMDWLRDELFDSKTAAEVKSELSQDDSFDWLTAADTQVDEAESSTLQGDEYQSDADEGVDDFPFGAADAQPDAPTRVSLARALDEAGFNWLDELRANAPEAASAEWLTAPPDVQREDDLSAAPMFYTESRNGGWNMTDNPQPPEKNEDSLDWLSNAQNDSAANSEFDMPELDSLAPDENDIPDWMSQMDGQESDEDSSLSAADIPTWLLQSDDSQSEELDSEGEAEEEIGWLSELAPAAEEAAEEDLSWLSDIDSEAKPSDLYEPPKAAFSAGTSEPADEFSWLSEEKPEPVDPNQTPDWLVALEEASEQGLAETKLSYQPDIQAEAEPLTDTPDWLAELEPDAASEPEVEAEAEPLTEAPDWLAELQPELEIDGAEVTTASDSAEDAFGWYDEAETEDEPAVDETPEWLQVLSEDSADEAIEAPLNEAEPARQESGAAEEEVVSTVMSEFEDEIAAPAPAENAPDWLNAMVPGLDVDFEAREEEIAEDAVSAGASRRDYEWVIALVEDEAAQTELAAAYPRFVFTRQPAWLTPPALQTAGQDDDLPEWPTDREKDADQNDDMPEWLR